MEIIRLKYLAFIFFILLYDVLLEEYELNFFIGFTDVEIVKRSAREKKRPDRYGEFLRYGRVRRIKQKKSKDKLKAVSVVTPDDETMVSSTSNGVTEVRTDKTQLPKVSSQKVKEKSSNEISSSSEGMSVPCGRLRLRSETKPSCYTIMVDSLKTHKVPIASFGQSSVTVRRPKPKALETIQHHVLQDHSYHIPNQEVALLDFLNRTTGEDSPQNVVTQNSEKSDREKSVGLESSPVADNVPEKPPPEKSMVPEEVVPQPTCIIEPQPTCIIEPQPTCIIEPQPTCIIEPQPDCLVTPEPASLVVMPPPASVVKPQPTFDVATAKPQPAFEVTTAKPQPAFEVATAKPQPAFEVATAKSEPAFEVATAKPQPAFEVATAKPQPAFEVATAKSEPAFEVTTAKPQPAFEVTTVNSSVTPKKPPNINVVVTLRKKGDKNGNPSNFTLNDKLSYYFEKLEDEPKTAVKGNYFRGFSFVDVDSSRFKLKWLKERVEEWEKLVLLRQEVMFPSCVCRTLQNETFVNINNILSCPFCGRLFDNKSTQSKRLAFVFCLYYSISHQGLCLAICIKM
jgi:hypothetical protein